MNIRRFFGKNSREALAFVRRELGDDAVILSNRAVTGGNEIMAFREDEMNAIINNETPKRFVKEFNYSQKEDGEEPTTLMSLLNKNNHSAPTEFSVTKVAKQVANIPANTTENDAMTQPVAQKEPKAPEIKTQVVATHQKSDTQESEISTTSRQMAYMLSEMRSMRSVIESQLTALSWGNIQQRDPVKTEILSILLAAGYSPALSRYLAEKLPQNLDSKKANEWVRYILAKNLNTIEDESETLLDQGGVFALIGPTGVGKTTTTAKLAARYVMKHGTQNLGLITTDAYRVGGHEQLRIYGKILGVMVHAVKDETDLVIALNELKNKHTILIDTVGVSQRDRMVTEQIAMLSSTKTPIKKLLCLNATSTGETLTDVIQAYKGKGLDGCIITKLDEAATIGNTLDVIIRGKLKLYYTANGQRVPEDIKLASKTDLIQLALNLKAAGNKPFQFLDEELPFVMGNTASAKTSSQLAEI